MGDTENKVLRLKPKVKVKIFFRQFKLPYLPLLRIASNPGYYAASLILTADQQRLQCLRSQDASGQQEFVEVKKS